MSVSFSLPTAASATSSLDFNPSLVSITKKRPMPIQQIEIAVSGKEWIRELHTNIEEIWEIDFESLHEADTASFQGFSSLDSFIRLTASFHRNTFEVTDADGDSLIGFYVNGIDQFVEGGGREHKNSRAHRFFGTLTFRKTL